MVTELDKLVRAQQYITKLAEGVDPITDIELPQDTVLGNVRLSRCFFYVAGVLSQMIEGYEKIPTEALPEFYITKDELRKVAVAEEPVNVTALLKAVSNAAPGRKKLAPTAVTGWLVQQGYLKAVAAEGKSRKEVTPKGALPRRIVPTQGAAVRAQPYQRYTGVYGRQMTTRLIH